MKKLTLKPISAAIGATFAVSLIATPLASASENPFDLKELSSGYTAAAEEGSCAEGKCAEGTCAVEGKCGGPPPAE